MIHSIVRFRAAALLCAIPLAATACKREAQATPATDIQLESGVYTIDHPERFRTATAESRALPTELIVNGTVAPDIARTIHVTALGSGRVVELKARLGDQVQKGQSLVRISSSDLASAAGDYQKARADEELARRALERAVVLLEHGALAQKDLETAQDAEAHAKADLRTAEERLALLGGDPQHLGGLIDLKAPVAGTIIEQNVAGNEGVKSPDNSPSLFTIADLSQVWILCDVYENDLASVREGDRADIRVNAAGDRIFHGTVSNVSRVLDPMTRVAKVRVVLDNPGRILTPGMFAVATLRSQRTAPNVLVPVAAVLRLQDKDWVFRREGPNRFRRIEIHAGALTHDGYHRVLSGVAAGDQLVGDALAFSAAIAEQTP